MISFLLPPSDISPLPPLTYSSPPATSSTLPTPTPPADCTFCRLTGILLFSGISVYACKQFIRAPPRSGDRAMSAIVALASASLAFYKYREETDQQHHQTTTTTTPTTTTPTTPTTQQR
eukprot:GHVS01027103.1.p1 GENE.GHVS01027103.1~~GHVS01027103.1.p1  ORF type:complete len:119 (+),score=41.51 GHVS01027103.1:185-541(+)